ncbi:uncharacterized protein [Ambystoma mexicanum]|uniref:uncharacterized protein isoform X2 n=1 Tax=Ambystoma mexicanum TaxID=8296 RepID=UPI0037E7D195
MAAVSQSQPLSQLSFYHSGYKVDVNIKKPLQPILQMSPEQVSLEMLSLCAQLDVLIKREVLLLQEKIKEDISPTESEMFHTLGAELRERMYEYLNHLPEPIPQLEDFLDTEGLSMLFPRVEIFLIHQRPVDMLEKPQMDEYFVHMGKLNQLLVLSQQMEDDLMHLGSHKYIAHQLSVLYKFLNYFNGCLPLDILKRDIEINFKSIKSALKAEEGSMQEPLLSGYCLDWILNVTNTVITTVSSLPDELTEEIAPALSHSSAL